MILIGGFIASLFGDRDGMEKMTNGESFMLPTEFWLPQGQLLVKV